LLDFGTCHGAVDQPIADRAKTAQGTSQWRTGAILRHVERRAPWSATAKTEEFARLTFLFHGLSRSAEGAHVGAVNKGGTPATRFGKSGRDPSPDRLLVRANERGKLGNRVAAMDFYTAEVEPPRHGYFSTLMSARMSSTRQTVTPLLILTGGGNFPLLTPAHHVDFETGIGPFGPRIAVILTNPSAGSAPRRTSSAISVFGLCCIP
jgi:hypothetical protein